MTLASDANLKWVGMNTRSFLGVTCNKPMRVPSLIPSLIFWQCVCGLRWDRCMTTWISNFKWLNLWPNNMAYFTNGIAFSSTTSESQSRGKENFTHIWYVVLWPQLWLYLMICGKKLTDIVCYHYGILYRYWLVFIICIFPPLIHIAMDCIMRYVFSLRVFKQMGAHTLLHSFF